MASSSELLIDVTEIMLRYQSFNSVLEFYHGALEGVVYHYLSELVKNRLHCNNDFSKDDELIDEVLAKYRDSTAYRMSENTYPGNPAEETIVFICIGLIYAVRSLVEEYLELFKKLPANFQFARWAGTMLLVELHYSDERVEYG